MGEQEKVIVHSARGRRGLLRAFASGTSCPKSHKMRIDASKTTVLVGMEASFHAFLKC